MTLCRLVAVKRLYHIHTRKKCLYIHAIVEDDKLNKALQSTPNFYVPENSDKFESVFRFLISASKIPKYHNDIDETINFLEILSLLFKASFLQNDIILNSDKNMNIIRNAVKYIDENFTENITLNDVASHVHFSKIYFHNFFLKATGQTPHDYLLTKRINNVKFLLTSTDKSFSEIALDSGFSSQAYMTYVLKKTNCTPKQYKKNCH